MVNNDPDILAYLRSILMPNPRVRPDINDMIGRLNTLRSVFHKKFDKTRQEEEERRRSEEEIARKRIAELEVISNEEEPASAPSPRQPAEQKPSAKPIPSTQLTTPPAQPAEHKPSAKPIQSTQPASPLSQTPQQNQPQSLQEQELLKHQMLLQQQEQNKQRIIENIRFQPLKYQPEELSFFKKRVTKITNYLYLGDREILADNYVSELKSKLRITHVVDCVDTQNTKYNQQFEFKVVPPRELIKQFRDVFGIIGRVAKEKGMSVSFCSLISFPGRVLVTSESGFGASLIIGFLMEARMLSFFEAYQFVYKRRYVATLEAQYAILIYQLNPFRNIQQLMEWEKMLHKDDVKQYFQCMCGACHWILLKPFDKTEQHQNPIPCNCEVLY